MKSNYLLLAPLGLTIIVMILTSGCLKTTATDMDKKVPHQRRWGIYALDLSTGNVQLIYSTINEMSGLALHPDGTSLAFCIKGSAEILDTTSEIYTVDTDGTNLNRLTNNDYFDARPSFSPDGSQIIFLSKRNDTLDLYLMDSDGGSQCKLYDSGGHDSDVCWGDSDIIVFTRSHQIWTLKPDGTNPEQITDPPNGGHWGIANLPIGDYDPRLSPDGSKIVFERLENPDTPHGGYNLFLANSNGTGEIRLTDNGYAQGMASWSHSGTRIVYIVATIGDQGKYDIYMMNDDGSDNQNVMPDYFPDSFLAHEAIFSKDDSKLFFIGEWWQ